MGFHRLQLPTRTSNPIDRTAGSGGQAGVGGHVCTGGLRARARGRARGCPVTVEGAGLSRPRAQTPARGPAATSLLRSSVIRAKDPPPVPPARPCYLGLYNPVPRRCRWLRGAGNEASRARVHCSDCPVTVTTRSGIPDLKLLLCLRPIFTLFFERHFLNLKFMQESYFPPHSDFPIPLVFHHNCFLSSEMAVFVNFGGGPIVFLCRRTHGAALALPGMTEDILNFFRGWNHFMDGFLYIANLKHYPTF